MSKVDVLDVNKITIEQLSEIYFEMGYLVKNLSLNNKSLLELSRSSKSIDYIVYIHLENTKLNLNDVNNIVSEIKSCYSKQIPNNYMIISIKGYDNDSKDVNGKNLNIYELEKINIRLEDDSYVEDLIDMYNKNSLSSYLDLFAHNKIAYKQIKESFNDNKRVCIAHATGTGKTILISKCIEDFKDEEILVLSSSNYILDYFSSYDNISSNNINLMTYSKLSMIKEFEFKALIESNPKLIILDEYHRCGAPSWYNRVVKLLESLPNSYALGTSATPIRYLDEGRNMSNELFDNNIVSSISLYDAIARNILPMPKYVVALYDFVEKINELDDEIDKAKNNYAEKNKLREKIEALKDINNNSKYIEKVISKHISNEKNFIIFCKDLLHMTEMIPIVKKWFSNISNDSVNINTYKLYSGYKKPLDELNKYLETINNDKNSYNLLFTIDMLNEGVHAKNIQGVILLRPTISPNIYYQQIGRAMSVNSSTTPLIFDFVNNSDTIQTNTFYDSIEQAIFNLPDEIDINSNFNMNYVVNNIFDETKDTLSLFLDIEKSLRNSWDCMYNELYEYFKINGHIFVKESENLKLYNWITRCGQLYKLGKIEQYKIDKLNELNFIWDRTEQKWQTNFEILKDYKVINGHTNVTKEENSSLATWIKHQKIAKKEDTLSKDKIEKLESLGIIWNLKDYIWENNYNEILKIKNQIGHLDLRKAKTYINSNNEEVLIDSKLRTWLSCQKRSIRNNEIRPDRVEKLKLLGIEINPKISNSDAKWIKNIEKLLEYKNEYGNMNVSKNYKDKSLYNFVVRIRNTKNTLSKEKLKELEDIGFVWSSNEFTWNNSFNNLAAFVKENGAITPNSKTHPKEKSWYEKQKQIYKLGNLRQDRVEKILSLGYVLE